MSRSIPRVNSDRPIGGRYKIVCQLGAGGFGRTFLAQDMHLPGQPQCVVKQLKPQTTDHSALQMARRCFNTEAQVLYQLGSHDQIPRLLAHFEDNQEFYLVQEFVKGHPLSKELSKGQPWTERQAIALMQDVLQVLSFVHEQQVIHRDIKPSNLIRRHEDHRIVLIDFGAVKQVGVPNADLETGLTNLTISIGTQGYMPNEQIAGKPRLSSDVYAIGVIGIQVLTGIHPRHLGEDEKGEIEWHHRAPHVSRDLLDVIDRMVRYDFRDRFKTAIEVSEALEALPERTHEPDTLPEVWSELAEANGKFEEAAFPDHTVSGANGFSLHTAEADDPALADSAEPVSTAIWVSTEATSPSDRSTHATHALGRAYNSALTPPNEEEPAQRKPWLRPWLLVPILGLAGLALVLGTTILPQYLKISWLGNADPGLNSDPTTSSSASSASPQQQAEESITLANQLRDKGDYVQALELYDQAITLDSNKAEAYWGKCDALNALKRPSEAVVACNDALAFQPNYPEALFGKGMAYGQQGRWYEALKLFEDATQLDPELARAWVNRGIALQRLGRSAEALVALDRGIALERNIPEAWSSRGEALLNLRRYNDAIAALDKALELEPDNPAVRQMRQQAEQRRN
jgi:eukaryotic-like serine/threonine-protein kinase